MGNNLHDCADTEMKLERAKNDGSKTRSTTSKKLKSNRKDSSA